jgi:hypothetical protein
MPIAQGINKIVAIKKQTALGSPATGAGATALRREQSSTNLKKETYANNEIATHQQSTGKTHGNRSVDTSLNGVLSTGTYSAVIGSILRRDFAAVAPIATQSITFAGAAGAWTATGTGFLAGGVKVGCIFRITTGSVTANNSRNFLATSVTATVITFIALDGATVASGASTTCVTTLTGKRTYVPDTGHTKDYYTLEEWYGDLSVSQTYTDIMFGKLDIGLPATGNATIAVTGVGLDRPVSTGVRVFTTPTESTTNPIAAVNGVLIVNGVKVTNITGVTISIDGKAASMGAVVGANVSPDIQRGSIEVSGSFTALFDSMTLSDLFNAATSIALVAVITDGSTAMADFLTITLPSITLDGDSKDDGNKGIVGTYPFTARICDTTVGGAALAYDRTIISIQDSE